MPWGRRKKEGENKVGKTGRGVSGKFQADLIIHKGSSLQVVVCCCVFDLADLLISDDLPDTDLKGIMCHPRLQLEIFHFMIFDF